MNVQPSMVKELTLTPDSAPPLKLALLLWKIVPPSMRGWQTLSGECVKAIAPPDRVAAPPLLANMQPVIVFTTADPVEWMAPPKEP